MVSIDYFFSVLSPFTYLAGSGLEQVAGRHDARIHYRPMDILQVFAETGGTPPAKRHWSRREYRLQELRRISATRRLPLNESPAHFPTNQLPASAAIIAAQEAGLPVGPLAHAFLRAVWAEERDIGQPATVNEILAECEIDVDGIGPHLSAAEDIYAANTRAAVEGGVFGSPFYVVGEERFWGQDRLPQLDSYLASVGRS